MKTSIASTILCFGRALLGALSLLLVGVVAAEAQATRTWVSGVGDDANPCSRTAPCKTFAGAISKTAAGGAINTLDPGGFGAVTITKSISIVSNLGFGGILNTSTSGIIVNAGPNDVVALHGLVIDGGGTGGLFGIRFLAGKSLHINNCIIRNQTQGAAPSAIEIVPTAGTSFVQISDCDISASPVGVRAKPTAPAIVKVFMDHVRIDRATGGAVESNGAGASVTLHDSSLTFNGFGLHPLSGGEIVSLGNNALIGNNPDIGPTSTTPLR